MLKVRTLSNQNENFKLRLDTVTEFISVNMSKCTQSSGDINFSYFSLKPYDVTTHLNHLDETVQMRGHNICFYAELDYPLINI